MTRYEVTILLKGGLILAQEILTLEDAERQGFEIATDLGAWAFVIETVDVERQETHDGERPKSHVRSTAYHFLKSIEEEEAEVQRAARRYTSRRK